MQYFNNVLNKSLMSCKFLNSVTAASACTGYCPVTSDFYGSMNIHHGTVISAIVTVNLLFCILHFNALFEELCYAIRVTLHKNRICTTHLSRS